MSTYVNLHSIPDMNKVIGPNFLDWLWNLRIVSKAKRIAYVLGLFSDHVSDCSVAEIIVVYDSSEGCLKLN